MKGLKLKGLIKRTALFLALILIGLPVFSQSKAGTNKKEKMEGKSVKFLPIPYLNYDQSFGFQYGAIPLFMIDLNKTDTISPPSMFGGFGMYSTTKSWMLLGYGKLFLDEDNWRIKGAYGKGSFNFQFFVGDPLNIFIPYNTEADFALIHAEKKLIKNLYAGIGYKYIAFDTSLDSIGLVESVKLKGLTFSLSVDRRDDVYYPRDGIYANLKNDNYSKWMGNDSTSNTIEFDYNHYFKARSDKDIIAARFFTGVGLGDVSFNQQQIVGNVDLRGYVDGKYRGKSKMAIQGEYRWNFYKQFGAVGFAGIATVFKAINDEDSGKILPSAGVGLRYKLMGDMISVGIDAAAGIDDWGIYFRISEAF